MDQTCQSEGLIYSNSVSQSVKYSINTGFLQGLNDFVFHSFTSKCGFTLAEVLVTLGIIGIVASMTMPTLMANHRKKVVETKLQKFVAVMSQALIDSERENGMIQDWLPKKRLNDAELKVWYETYITKYLKSDLKSYNGDTTGYYHISLADGSGFASYTNAGYAYVFYCLYDKDVKMEAYDGKKCFLFQITRKGIIAAYDGSSEEWAYNSCKNGSDNCTTCRHGCAKLLEYNDWKVPDNYPVGL